MKTLLSIKSATLGAALLGLSLHATAIPTLQLGIAGGTYNLSTQTIIASSNSFSLYAFLIPDRKNPVNDLYTISMAVSPQVDIPMNLGSFTVDGNVIDVTSGMNYGIPPADATIETTPGGSSKDLQTHGVFPTYFTERSFSFSLADISGKFNTADHPSYGPQSGAGMYFKKFDIDVSNLDPNYSIHFDLYNTKPIMMKVCEEGDNEDGHRRSKKKNNDDDDCSYVPSGELDISDKAPFSHDAQSGPGGGGGGGNEVPEPAPMLLLGLGLAGMFWKRKRS